jgi:hypothetical protein
MIWSSGQKVFEKPMVNVMLFTISQAHHRISGIEWSWKEHHDPDIAWYGSPNLR